MSDDRGLERVLRGVLRSATPTDAPDGLFDSIVSTSGRVRPRPRWLASLKERPMRLHSRVVAGSPALRTATTFALTAALMLAIAGAVAAGASLLPSTPVPDPFGLARNGLLAYSAYGDIHVADPDGQNPRAIISGPDNDIAPVFSRDGTKLVFGRGRPGAASLMIADADGTDPRELMPPADGTVQFMPSGTELVGYRLVEDHPVLFMLDVASGASRDLDLGGLELDGWLMPRPPDGQEILFTASRPRQPALKGLYAIRPDGSGLRPIGEVSTTENQEGDARDPSAWRISFQNPAISPDGSTVGFWNWEPRDGTGPSDAYMHMRDVDTGEELSIEFDPLGADHPKGDDYGLLIQFSPDGQYVVFEGCSAGGDSWLCHGTLDGSRATTPIGPAYDYTERKGFTISPDGRKVLLALTHGSRIIDVDSGQATPVGILSSDEAAPAWQRLAP